MQCRLDYFLTSRNLINITRNCDIIHAPSSDHCAFKLFIQSEVLNKKPGPGFWKFNGSLFEGEVYIKEIKNSIETYRDKYYYLADKGLKWDLIKMELRGFSNCIHQRESQKEPRHIKRATKTIK